MPGTEKINVNAKQQRFWFCKGKNFFTSHDEYKRSSQCQNDDANDVSVQNIPLNDFHIKLHLAVTVDFAAFRFAMPTKPRYLAKDTVYDGTTVKRQKSKLPLRQC